MPWEAAYETLPLEGKWEHCREALARERAKPMTPQRLNLVKNLEAQVKHEEGMLVLFDPKWDCAHNLYIAPKKGPLVPLVPNPQQAEIIDLYVRHKAANEKLFVIIIKARQEGMSTIISGLNYAHVRNGENQDIQVMSHDDPGAEELFRIYSRFHEHDPWKAETTKGTVKELRFAPPTAGKIVVRTAGAKGAVARGSRLHGAHLSELAQWPNGGYDAFNAIMPAVVDSPEAWCMVWIETTGNGQQGVAYDIAMEADQAERDNQPGLWKLVFLPWYKRFDAFAPIHSQAEEDAIRASMTDWERQVSADYSLSLEQIKWARLVLDKARGETPAEKRRWFNQEFPTVLHDSFQSTGGGALDPAVVNNRIAIITRDERALPPWQGDITADSDERDWNEAEAKYVEETPRPLVTRREGGPLTIRRFPVAGHRYCFGVDLAHGLARGDWTVATVFDRTSHEFVATFRAKLNPHMAVAPVRLLSAMYNNALIAPETNLEPAFCNWLADTDRRDYLYVERNPGQVAIDDSFKRNFGWKATEAGKRRLVSVLRQWLHYKPAAFTCPVMLREMLVIREVLNKATAKLRYAWAPKGAHDDTAVCGGITLICHEDMPMETDSSAPTQQGDDSIVARVLRTLGRIDQEERRGDSDWLVMP